MALHVPIHGAVPDHGWCDPDDLWGIGFPTPVCMIPSGVQENAGVAAKPKQPARFSRVLDAYQLQLSTNPKTLLSFNSFQQYSCRPTRLCKVLCYGHSVNLDRNDHNVDKVLRPNAISILEQRTASQRIEIADAIRNICRSNGIDNLRWHGIGDLTRGPELELIDELTNDPDFVLWGFTRKGDVLEQLPVRHNIIFSLSIDRTMTDKRLALQARAAEMHDTGLAVMTEMGAPYRGRMIKGVPLPPWEKPRPWEPPNHWAPGPDPIFDRLDALGLTHAIAFGYHASNRLTRTTVDRNNVPTPWPDECPGTDPLGGGHFYGTCQRCGWCIRKNANRAASLGVHRRKYVPADDYDNATTFGEVRLEDGKQKGVPMPPPRANPVEDDTDYHDTVRVSSTRWTEAMKIELAELFHVARTALAAPGRGPVSRYEQRCWAAREFHKAHPTIGSTAAYKQLLRDDAWRY